MSDKSKLKAWLDSLTAEDTNALIHKVVNHANGFEDQARLDEYLVELSPPMPIKVGLAWFLRGEIGTIRVRSRHSYLFFFEHDFRFMTTERGEELEVLGNWQDLDDVRKTKSYREVY